MTSKEQLMAIACSVFPHAIEAGEHIELLQCHLTIANRLPY